MNNWFKNIFGTMGMARVPAPKNVDFIPLDNKGDVLQITNDNASWVGLNSHEMQYWAYIYCSPLAAVIDRSAECGTNGVVEFLKANGSDDYSNSANTRKLKLLLAKPNPLQTWEQFRGQQIIYKKIYGYCPVYAMVPAGFQNINASYLWNLDPNFARPVRNDLFNLTNGQNAIKSWRISVFGESYDIPSEYIFILKDGYLNSNIYNVYLPLSKIEGLEWAISNICAAMEADNVLLRKKGPLGFISHDPKPDNVSGYVPMTKEQKNEIQANLQQYGLTWSQFQYVITKLPVRWNPISFNVQELMTKETTRQAIDMICDRYNYPAELMSGKNATYENRNSAEKFLYQNNVIPSSLRDMRTYNSFFELDNEVMSEDFSELPVLQEDIASEATALNQNAQGNLILFQNSVITLNEYRKRMGIDTVKGDDIYFEDYKKKYGVPEPPTSMKVVPPGKQNEKVA